MIARTTIVTVVGARPQFVKAAAVSGLLRERFSEVLVHTGQHYDPRMSRVFFEELSIPRPNMDLGVGSGSHGSQTGQMLEAVEVVLEESRPALVLVYGDTNSTLAGALAATKLQIPVAHVEAGLRSGNKAMPEEINRVVTDHVADLLLCPTPTAVAHLSDEGIIDGVVLTGDVMVDALDSIRPLISRDRLDPYGVGAEPYFVATLHRAETVDDPKNLERAFAVLAAVHGEVVVPVHPRTGRAVDALGLSWPGNVRLIDPVGYADMMSLVAHAEAVLTDSGGLQKEAVLLETRCLTLRTETEWPETLQGGWNTLVGIDVTLAEHALAKSLGDPATAAFSPGAARNVVDAITTFLES